VFANYKQKEKVEAVDRLLSRYPELAMFERAQLGSLGRQSPEEAKTLIPSLNSKIDDETLRSLLDLLEDLWED
jgi:DNA-directed RNA polymerase II subunit RPB4